MVTTESFRTALPVEQGCKYSLVFARQNTHASLKLTNLRESVWKELYTKIMKTTLQKKGVNSLNHYNLVHKFIPMPQAMKIREATAKNSGKFQHGN